MAWIYKIMQIVYVKNALVTDLGVNTITIH